MKVKESKIKFEELPDTITADKRAVFFHEFCVDDESKKFF